MRNKVAATAAVFLCLFVLLAGMGSSVASAKEDSQTDMFSGDITYLRQDNNNYVMQVTVENRGEDFEGTVQVVFAGMTGGNCAYNTELTLPAQGKKQFTVTVTAGAADTNRGVCRLNFLDEKGHTLQSIPFNNVFGNTMTGIAVGILSDNYSGLTYLDAGGRDFSIMNISYPLELIELSGDNLQSYLDGLYFLVIDHYNVSQLGQETIQAIQEWVKDGGWLMIGTGAYAEETLSGFDEDFLDVEIVEISEPGAENILSANAERYGYYYNYRDVGIDFSQMAVADLNFNDHNGNYPKEFYDNSLNPSLCIHLEDGAVGIYYISLEEQQLQKLDDYSVQNMYENIMYNSSSFQTFNNGSEVNYIGRESIAYIDNLNTNVDFTWLEVLIGIYVVMVGPVLYLILRKCKRREWYWMGVPILGLLFIGGVFFFGRGASVNETRVYSVTVQQTDKSWADTYFLAYRSGVKEWDMRLDSRYEVAGPGLDYYRGSGTNADDYHYVVTNGAEGLSVGMKPYENFESGFLYAGQKAESTGNFSGSGLERLFSSLNAEGTVTNGTNRDLAYMGVWYNAGIMVFSDVKAGETLDIAQAAADGRCVYQNTSTYLDSLRYDMLGLYGYSTSSIQYERDDVSALFIALTIANEGNPNPAKNAVIAGVVPDYEKAVADKCKEISYGCLYSYVEMEGDSNASN